MDFAGFSWSLVIIVGAAVLAAVIAFAALRNRADAKTTSATDAATRRVYEEEDREHRGESDNVI